jgi:serine/threonine protein kinase
MQLTPGTKLAEYEILASIGAGGMGEVYRARDPRLGREVAIKVLPFSLSQNVNRLARFEQEARAVAALNHPNVLAIYDVGNDQGVPFLVTELLEGETLHDRINGGSLTRRKAVEWIGMALDNGLTVDWVERTPSFNSLREDDRYRELVRQSTNRG